jgi:hypothetical protein
MQDNKYDFDKFLGIESKGSLRPELWDCGAH